MDPEPGGPSVALSRACGRRGAIPARRSGCEVGSVEDGYPYQRCVFETRAESRSGDIRLCRQSARDGGYGTAAAK